MWWWWQRRRPSSLIRWMVFASWKILITVIRRGKWLRRRTESQGKSNRNALRHSSTYVLRETVTDPVTVITWIRKCKSNQRDTGSWFTLVGITFSSLGADGDEMKARDCKGGYYWKVELWRHIWWRLGVVVVSCRIGHAWFNREIAGWDEMRSPNKFLQVDWRD